MEVFSLDIPLSRNRDHVSFLCTYGDIANLRNVVPITHYGINTMDYVQRNYSHDTIIQVSLSFTFKNMLTINLLVHKPIRII
jgi:hypothetical protein